MLRLVFWIIFLSALGLKAQVESAGSDSSVQTSTSVDVASVQRLLNEAYLHMRVPYMYGGKSPRGFDCSGFVGYCFGQTLQQDMPQRSADYMDFGQEISLMDCRPGDIICFNGRSINRIIGHVGIIVDGHSDNPLFIHASTSQGVRVDALKSPYFEPRFVGVRRVIQP